MSSSSKLIQDLILFYVKENYNHYLKENELEKIPENQIENVVDTIYTTKKEHLKGFLKESLKKKKFIYLLLLCAIKGNKSAPVTRVLVGEKE